MQPNDKAGSPKMIWDEENQCFIFQELSYQLSSQFDTANPGSETEVLDIKMNSKVQMTILATNGDLTDLIMDIQHSPNLTGPWFDSGVSSSGGSGITPIFPDSARYVKGVVNTPGQEGSNATVIITAR